jgi:hypothetical protein
MQDSTGLPTYQVTCKVLHKNTYEPISNCEITNFEQQVNTNISGLAILENVNSLLILNFEKENFYQITNNQLSIYSDTTLIFYLTPKEYDVTIFVQDQKTGQTFDGTPVVFNGTTQVTNSTGETYFQAYEGNFPYSIEKNSYINIAGNVTVKSDTTFHFYLVRSRAYIKFKLKEGTTPVNNATVILNGDTLITNKLGIANFSSLPILSDYNYFIYKGGYNDISGSLYLSSDTTIDIQMDAYLTGIVSTFKNDKLKIWPNPVKKLLHIHFPNNITNGIIEIRTLSGNLIHSIPFENKSSFEFNTGNLKAGIYLLNVVSFEKQIKQLFIKNE